MAPTENGSIFEGGADPKLTRVFNLSCCVFEQQENEVITMEMIGKIRRMNFRDKKFVRTIARMTGLSRNTIRKWLQTPVDNEPTYRRSAQPNKLTPFNARSRQTH